MNPEKVTLISLADFSVQLAPFALHPSASPVQEQDNVKSKSKSKSKGKGKSKKKSSGSKRQTTTGSSPENSSSSSNSSSTKHTPQELSLYTASGREKHAHYNNAAEQHTAFELSGNEKLKRDWKNLDMCIEQAKEEQQEEQDDDSDVNGWCKHCSEAEFFRFGNYAEPQDILKCATVRCVKPSTAVAAVMSAAAAASSAKASDSGGPKYTCASPVDKKKKKSFGGDGCCCNSSSICSCKRNEKQQKHRPTGDVDSACKVLHNLSVVASKLLALDCQLATTTRHHQNCECSDDEKGSGGSGGSDSSDNSKDGSDSSEDMCDCVQRRFGAIDGDDSGSSNKSLKGFVLCHPRQAQKVTATRALVGGGGSSDGEASSANTTTTSTSTSTRWMCKVFESKYMQLEQLLGSRPQPRSKIIVSCRETTSSTSSTSSRNNKKKQRRPCDPDVSGSRGDDYDDPKEMRAWKALRSTVSEVTCITYNQLYKRYAANVSPAAAAAAAQDTNAAAAVPSMLLVAGSNEEQQVVSRPFLGDKDDDDEQQRQKPLVALVKDEHAWLHLLCQPRNVLDCMTCETCNDSLVLYLEQFYRVMELADRKRYDGMSGVYWDFYRPSFLDNDSTTTSSNMDRVRALWKSMSREEKRTLLFPDDAFVVVGPLDTNNPISTMLAFFVAYADADDHATSPDLVHAALVGKQCVSLPHDTMMESVLDDQEMRFLQDYRHYQFFPHKMAIHLRLFYELEREEQHAAAAAEHRRKTRFLSKEVVDQCFSLGTCTTMLCKCQLQQILKKCRAIAASVDNSDATAEAVAEAAAAAKDFCSCSDGDNNNIEDQKNLDTMFVSNQSFWWLHKFVADMSTKELGEFFDSGLYRVNCRSILEQCLHLSWIVYRKVMLEAIASNVYRALLQLLYEKSQRELLVDLSLEVSSSSSSSPSNRIKKQQQQHRQSPKEPRNSPTSGNAATVAPVPPKLVFLGADEQPCSLEHLRDCVTQQLSHYLVSYDSMQNAAAASSCLFCRRQKATKVSKKCCHVISCASCWNVHVAQRKRGSPAAVCPQCRKRLTADCSLTIAEDSYTLQYSITQDYLLQQQQQHHHQQQQQQSTTTLEVREADYEDAILDTRNMCVGCGKAPRCVVEDPCGHLLFCKACASSNKKHPCLLCKRLVTFRLAIRD